jgi:hypothetical protein
MPRTAFLFLLLDAIEYFLTVHSDVPRRIDSKPNELTFDSQHRNGGVISDFQGFAEFARQDQHEDAPPASKEKDVQKFDSQSVGTVQYSCRIPPGSRPQFNQSSLD